MVNVRECRWGLTGPNQPNALLVKREGFGGLAETSCQEVSARFHVFTSPDVLIADFLADVRGVRRH